MIRLNLRILKCLCVGLYNGKRFFEGLAATTHPVPAKGQSCIHGGFLDIVGKLNAKNAEAITCAVFSRIRLKMGLIRSM